LILGYSFDTRPLTAAAIGGAAISVMGLHSIVTRGWIRSGRILITIAAGFIITGSLTLAWNYRTTGNPLQATFNVIQPFDRIGFGTRGMGYTDGETVQHTPLIAVRRMFGKTIPAILQNLSGTGFYDPKMSAWIGKPGTKEHLMFLFGMAAFSASIFLLVRPFTKRSFLFADLLFAAIVVADLAAYSLHFMEGVVWGFTPTNTRYHAEAMMFGWLPLLARGTVIVIDRIKSASYGWRLACAVAAVLLAGNCAYNYFRFYEPLQSRGARLRSMKAAMEEIHSEKAVIYYVNGFCVPPGDYPFEKFDDARLVSYRLMRDPSWGLHETDWLTVHQKYFSDREPFLFDEENHLRPLQVAARKRQPVN
jgi:hypothetical protein